MKRLKILACKVLYREICMLSSHCENYVDVTYLQQGLHDTPDLLRKALQEEIDRIDAGDDLYSCGQRENKDFDAILLAYGLCSNAICGVGSKKYPLVVPRAHDCITLFLGSKEWYRQYFDEHTGGIFWYTPGWNESILMPGREREELMRDKYVAQFGEENADYLLDQENVWLKDYNTCAYVDWEALHLEPHARYAKECADYLHMNFDVLQGSPSLMEDLINGNWREEAFLVLEPGQKVTQSFEEETILEADDGE